MRAILRAVLVLVLIIVIVVVVVLVMAYGGFYNVAATYPGRGPVDWFLGTTMDYSVKRHAANIRVPSLDSPEMVRAGFQQYRALCLECHGAPGVAPEALAQGLNPEPPPLVEAAGDWKPNELFWIAKNGVRMSGMPAWGPTHTDEEIWEIVAFVRRLPKMSEVEYRTLDKQVPPLPTAGAEGAVTPSPAGPARSARPSPPAPPR